MWRRRHIIKGTSRALPFVSLNEHLCMQVAVRVLPTARTTVSQDGNVLVVDRFDVDAEGIAVELQASVVSGDDFCYPYRMASDWQALSPAERAAGIIDWRRMRAEALEPLLAGRVACWHPCDFQNFGSGLSAVVVTCSAARVSASQMYRLAKKSHGLQPVAGHWRSRVTDNASNWLQLFVYLQVGQRIGA